MLAAAVADLPVQIEMFDGYVAREPFRHYKARLAAVDILAIAAMSPLKALDTELTIRLAKTLNPRVQVVVGGNHASAFPEQWIEKGADFVITGEGEIAFRALDRGSEFRQPGCIEGAESRLRATGSSLHHGAASTTIHLDESPWPLWEPLDLRPYRLGTGRRGSTAAIEISRAARIVATFATSIRIGVTRQRYKSVERVVEEMSSPPSTGSARAHLHR